MFYNKYFKKINFYSEARKGFGLIEVLIVIALAAVVVPSMIQFSFFLTQTTNLQVRKTEALNLASEGIEAVYTMRNRSWTTEIASQNTGTTYYPVLSGNNWVLSLVNPGVVQGRYMRTIVFSAVNRDGNDNIAPTGTPDLNTLKVASTVSWNESGRITSVALQSYITNFLAN